MQLGDVHQCNQSACTLTSLGAMLKIVKSRQCAMTDSTYTQDRTSLQFKHVVKFDGHQFTLDTLNIGNDLEPSIFDNLNCCQSLLQSHNRISM